MVYWRVPTAYSTASVQDQFDAHQYPTSTPVLHVSTKRACLSPTASRRYVHLDAIEATPSSSR